MEFVTAAAGAQGIASLHEIRGGARHDARHQGAQTVVKSFGRRAVMQPSHEVRAALAENADFGIRQRRHHFANLLRLVGAAVNHQVGAAILMNTTVRGERGSIIDLWDFRITAQMLVKDFGLLAIDAVLQVVKNLT